VIEIAIAVLYEGVARMAIDTLIDPRRPIPSVITGVTRITQEMIRGKPCFAEIASDVVETLAGCVFVAHNLRFDWAFVSSEARRTLDVTLDGPRLCTVRLAKRLIPGLRSRSLDSVTRYLGIEIENRHRAGGDAMATALALRQMLNLAEERGIDTLRGLEDLQLPRKRKKRKKRGALPTPMEEG
jgi:DNA polymerase-3 subunit epsilon